MKFAKQIVQEIISRYKKGERATALAKEYNVGRSSIYRWLQEESREKVRVADTISYQDFYLMQVELERLRKDNEIFNACRCSRNSPLQEKYEEIDRLKDKYSIHSLCRVLAVRRSSYYHHALRSPEKNSY